LAEGQERQRASVNEQFPLVGLAAKCDVKAIASIDTSRVNEWRPLFRRALLSQAAGPL